MYARYGSAGEGLPASTMTLPEELYTSIVAYIDVGGAAEQSDRYGALAATRTQRCWRVSSSPAWRLAQLCATPPARHGSSLRCLRRERVALVAIRGLRQRDRRTRDPERSR